MSIINNKVFPEKPLLSFYGTDITFLSFYGINASSRYALDKNRNSVFRQRRLIPVFSRLFILRLSFCTCLSNLIFSPFPTLTPRISGIIKSVIFIVLSSQVNHPFHKLSTIDHFLRSLYKSINQDIPLIIAIFLILVFDYAAISATPE